IVSGAIGLGRRGAALGAAASSIAFCILAWSIDAGFVVPVATYVDRTPLPPGRLAVVMAANLSAFLLVGALSAFLAEQLQGARSQLAESEPRLAPLEERHVPGQVVLFEDLTDLRQMEETVRRQDRLAVVGGLAAGLAHEIRNPLASMCGSIEILGGSPHLDDQERKLLHVVLSEAERLEALVRDFLSFARP